MAGKQDRRTKPRNHDSGDRVVVAPPCAMVIFGATGDLTKRLILPALYNLVTANRLPAGFKLIGIGLSAKTTAEWRQGLEEMMKQSVAQGAGEFQVDHINETTWRWLTERMSYLQGDLNDPGTYS